MPQHTNARSSRPENDKDKSNQIANELIVQNCESKFKCHPFVSKLLPFESTRILANAEIPACAAMTMFISLTFATD